MGVVRVLSRALVGLSASVCLSSSFRCWVCAFCDCFGSPASSGPGVISSASGGSELFASGGGVGVGAVVVALVGVLPFSLLVVLWVVTLGVVGPSTGGGLRDTFDSWGVPSYA